MSQLWGRLSSRFLISSRNSGQVCAAAGSCPGAHYHSLALTTEEPEVKLTVPLMRGAGHSDFQSQQWPVRTRLLTPQGCMARPSEHSLGTRCWDGPDPQKLVSTTCAGRKPPRGKCGHKSHKMVCRAGWALIIIQVAKKKHPVSLFIPQHQFPDI